MCHTSISRHPIRTAGWGEGSDRGCGWPYVRTVSRRRDSLKLARYEPISTCPWTQRGVPRVRRFESFDEVQQAVEDAGGFLVCSMASLRDAVGWERLTYRAINQIRHELNQRDLDYYPNPLPDATMGRSSLVRIVAQGTIIHKIMRAINAPSGHGDHILKNVAKSYRDGTLQISTFTQTY